MTDYDKFIGQLMGVRRVLHGPPAAVAVMNERYRGFAAPVAAVVFDPGMKIALDFNGIQVWFYPDELEVVKDAQATQNDCGYGPQGRTTKAQDLLRRKRAPQGAE